MSAGFDVFLIVQLSGRDQFEIEINSHRKLDSSAAEIKIF